MGQDTTSNLRGTSATSFQFGKRGPRIRKGTADPNTLIFVDPQDGDVYVQTGTGTEALWQLASGTWVEFTPDLNRLLVNNEGQLLVNNDGNLIAGGC